MLEYLPTEIATLIIEKLPRRDLKSLCLVSKGVGSLVRPLLYERITIKCNDPTDLTKTNASKFFPALRAGLLSYVRHISFLGSMWQRKKQWCIHNQILDLETPDIFRPLIPNPQMERALTSSNPSVNSLGKLMSEVQPLFDSLQDDILLSFHWHLGTCLPQDLLGPGGYLTKHQRRIQDLSLITSDGCILPKLRWPYPICLTEFKSLKNLSWKGGLSRLDFESLRDVLRVHAKTIVSLKLVFVDCYVSMMSWCEDNPSLDDAEYGLQSFFLRGVLCLRRHATTVLFPSLETLSLWNLSICSGVTEIAYAFNISNLTSLDICYCDDLPFLLKAVVESGQPINLRSLQIAMDRSLERNRENSEFEWIKIFLESFDGLEDLSYVARYFFRVPAVDISSSLLHHRKTLKRLVYHDNNYNHITCPSYPENENIFEQLALEYFGTERISTILSFVGNQQSPLAQNLRFFSHRAKTTRMDFELGNTVWNNVGHAFREYPKLQCITLGSFADTTRDEGEIVEILCRRQPGEARVGKEKVGWRRAKIWDEDVMNMMDEYRGSLMACPVK